MNHINKRFAGLLLAGAASLTAAGAYAQQGEGAVLEEIVVTAQKRQESLQDVPVSVAVVSGDRLEEMSIDNLDDLAPYMGPGNPPTYISSVTYGRRFVLLIESTSSTTEMKASIRASSSAGSERSPRKAE